MLPLYFRIFCIRDFLLKFPEPIFHKSPDDPTEDSFGRTYFELHQAFSLAKRILDCIEYHGNLHAQVFVRMVYILFFLLKKSCAGAGVAGPLQTSDAMM